MNYNVTLVRSRKAMTINVKLGQWVLLAEPDEHLDKHIKVYRDATAKDVVNDDFERILSGRIQPTMTPRSFITTEENNKRKSMLADVSARSSSVAKSTAVLDDERRKVEQKSGQELLAKDIDSKNALVNSIRKASGQEPWDETETEKAQRAQREKLAQQDAEKKAAIEKRANELKAAAQAALEQRAKDAGRSVEEQTEFEKKNPQVVSAISPAVLAEKNALVDKIKQQAAEVQSGNTQAQADKQVSVEQKKQTKSNGNGGKGQAAVDALKPNS